MSGHTAENPCVICRMWERMPHAKRYTTPVQVAEAEGAMIAGYWVRARAPEGVAVRLCERHGGALFALDAQEEQRQALLAQAAHKAAQAEHAAEFKIRASGLASRMVAPVVQPNQAPAPILPSLIDPSLQAAASAPEPEPDTGINPNPTHTLTSPIMPPMAQVGEVVPDAPKVAFACPVCHQPTVAGGLHACPEPEV